MSNYESAKSSKKKTPIDFDNLQNPMEHELSNNIDSLDDK